MSNILILKTFLFIIIYEKHSLGESNEIIIKIIILLLIVIIFYTLTQKFNSKYLNFLTLNKITFNELLNIIFNNEQKFKDYPIFIEMFIKPSGEYTCLIYGPTIFVYIEKRRPIWVSEWVKTGPASVINPRLKHEFTQDHMLLVRYIEQFYGSQFWVKTIFLPTNKMFFFTIYSQNIISKLEIPELNIFVDFFENGIIYEYRHVQFSSYSILGDINGKIHKTNGSIIPIRFTFLPLEKYNNKIKYFNNNN